MANEQRVARLREEVKRETSDILRKVKDPRLGFVTVTDAEVSGDLQHVRIFVSVLGDGVAAAKTFEALKSATGFVRSELGQRIRLRHTPEVAFRLDESAERGARISQLLADIQRAEEVKHE